MNKDNIRDMVVAPAVIPASYPIAPNTHVPNTRATCQNVVCCGRGGKYFPMDLLAFFKIMESIFPIGPTE